MNEFKGTKLLSWVHFSDIHCAQGDKYEASIRKEVLIAATDDAVKQIKKLEVNFDFALISGDIFQMGGKSALEMEEIDAFTSDLSARLMLKYGIYCVPGNHDLDRGIEKNDASVRRLLDSLRRHSGELLDNALSGAVETDQLSSRFENYRRWITDNAFNRGAKEIAPLAWERCWVVDGITIRLRGINSAWLCMDSKDKGRLQVQLASVSNIIAEQRDTEINIITFHHPTDWLRNSHDIETRVMKHYDILMTGHVHEPVTSMYQSASGNTIVHVKSGALHDPTNRKKIWKRDERYRYSICSIIKEQNGDIFLYQWPRKWRKNDLDFVVDTDLTPDSEPYNVWPLRIRSPNCTSTPVSKNNGSTAKTIIRSVNATTSIERFGARRTAFPTDHSIAELERQDLIVPPIFSSTFGDDLYSLGVDGLSREILYGKHVLILGEPGSGKSVALFSLSRQLQKLGATPIPLRFSDLRRLFSSGIGLSHGFSVDEADKSVIVLVDGLDEANVAAGIGAKTISQWLEEIASQYTLVLSCRRAEYESQLSSFVSTISFSYLAYLRNWRPEVEFRDFIARLVKVGLLKDDSLVAVINADKLVASFAVRPLFARMLCLIGRETALMIQSLEELYIRFFEGLERRTQDSLADAGCYLMNRTIGNLWSESAWQSFRLGLIEDEALNYSALLSTLSDEFGTRECVMRALHAIIDTGTILKPRSASYVHYSFFEFLLSSALESRIIGEETLAHDRDSIEVLYNDIPRRVRHFLVNRLRKTGGWRGKKQLLDAYEYLMTNYTIEESRTGMNLIIYILSLTLPPSFIQF